METIKVYQNYRKVNWEDILNKPLITGQKYLNVESTLPTFRYEIVSVTANSITLNSTLTPNELQDKVVEYVCDEGVKCYAIVDSNSTDTLVLDNNLIASPSVGSNIDIISTLVLTENDLDSLVALNINVGMLGVILPKVSSDIERKYFNIYVEYNDFNNKAIILSRNGDTQLGEKYGELIKKGEGVTLYAHTWGADHWDIINTQGIYRNASGYWIGDESLPNNTTLNPIGEELVFDIDITNRFIEKTVSGFKHFKYTSLFKKDFFIDVTLNVNKSSTQSDDLYIYVEKMDRSGDTTISERFGKSTFKTKEGTQSISFKIPITLLYMDEVYLKAQHNSSSVSFTIEEGSAINIYEIN